MNAQSVQEIIQDFYSETKNVQEDESCYFPSLNVIMWSLENEKKKKKKNTN